MLKKEYIVNRKKFILDSIKKEYKKSRTIDSYERQINYYNDELCKKELIIQTNIEKVDNIMIVAHPDDETIFGFNELYNNENWLLIVCTNSVDGRIGITRKDIPGLIQMSKDYNFNLVVIEHFDCWETVKDDRFDISVYKHLKRYLTKQKWQKIITHNKDGEYGHPQHILVHRMVSTILFNNDVNYTHFKVFDFSDDITNDISLVKRNLRKYYLMGGSLSSINCDKVYYKDIVPINYDIMNIICI